MRKHKLYATLLCLFTLSIQTCKSTNKTVETSSDLQSNGDNTFNLVREQARFNGQFPQVNVGITIGLAGAILANSVPSASILATPSSAEIETMGKAMNAFHTSNNVNYKYNAPAPHQVSAVHLRDLIHGERLGALIKAHRAIYIIQKSNRLVTDISNQTLEKILYAHPDGLTTMGTDIDRAMKNQELSETLALIGNSLTDVFELESVTSFSASYREYLKSTQKPISEADMRHIFDQVKKLFRQELYKAFSKSLSKKLTDSEILRLTQAFVADTFDRES